MDIVVDIEANGFTDTATKVHCIVAAVVGSSEFYVYQDAMPKSQVRQRLLMEGFDDLSFGIGSLKDGIKFLNEADCIIGHNWAGYDQIVLERLVEEYTQDCYVDTFCMANLLYPEEYANNGIEEFGKRLGLDVQKVQVDDFSFLSETLLVRCVKDVLINKAVWKHLIGIAHEDKKRGVDWWPAIQLEQQVLREHTFQTEWGFGVDEDAAHRHLGTLDKRLAEIEKDLLGKIPKLAKPYNKLKEVSKPFLKTGDFSAATESWFAEDPFGWIHSVKGPFTRVVFEDMNLKSQDQVKDYLITLGWKPDEWNTKRGEGGIIIRTSPKLTESSYESLPPGLGADIAEFLVLSHRRNFIQNVKKPEEKGILGIMREDKRVPSTAMTCATPTSRYRHSGAVCNPPSVTAKFGPEVREIFCCGPTGFQVGVDLSGIEARMMCHFAYPYTGGKEFAEMVLHGDWHCYSGDTEVLTEGGWVRLDELKEEEEDRVCQYDTNTGVLSFVKPSQYFKDKAPILNVHPKTRMAVTPQHKQFLKGVGTPDRIVMDKDISYTNGSSRFVSGGVKEGLEVDPNILRAVVAIQADGSHVSKKGSFSFEFVKERKIKRFKKLFKGRYREGASKKGTRFYLDFPEALPYLIGKEFNLKELLKLSSSCLEVFVKELKYWDGTETKSGATVFDTTSEISCKVAHTLACLCGKKARYHYYRKHIKIDSSRVDTTVDMHRCYISEEAPYYSVLSDRPEAVKWNRFVYCLTVPSGFLLTRREGVIVVSGNTHNAALWGVSRSLAKRILYASLAHVKLVELLES